MYDWGYYRPYVSVAERRRKAEKAVAKMVKKGQKVSPVQLDGRTIASTFWGKAWCDHLESFSDYENRLPRGRTYVRNGSVIHLAIDEGEITALVQGSSLYKVKIGVKSVDSKKWRAIINSCSGEIDSVVELLQGKLSSSVMKVITDREKGLFPKPKEISLSCSCPDWATMCKHVAAVLYGVGARLDQEPELLFKLRHVNHLELISKTTLKVPTKRGARAQALADRDLSNLFGIEIDSKAKPTSRSAVRSTLKTKTETKVKAVAKPALKAKKLAAKPKLKSQPQAKATKSPVRRKKN